jgi:4-hydroxyphenylpyruvate dioxygenase
LPGRLQQLGVGSIDEELAKLRELEILVDGEGPKQYLLQIFLEEASGLFHDPAAGPFFFEIIQRKGSNGFGAGNFRALFESIERQQRLARRIS